MAGGPNQAMAHLIPQTEGDTPPPSNQKSSQPQRTSPIGGATSAPHNPRVAKGGVHVKVWPPFAPTVIVAFIVKNDTNITILLSTGVKLARQWKLFHGDAFGTTNCTKSKSPTI